MEAGVEDTAVTAKSLATSYSQGDRRQRDIKNALFVYLETNRRYIPTSWTLPGFEIKSMIQVDMRCDENFAQYVALCKELDVTYPGEFIRFASGFYAPCLTSIHIPNKLYRFSHEVDSPSLVYSGKTHTIMASLTRATYLSRRSVSLWRPSGRHILRALWQYVSTW